MAEEMFLEYMQYILSEGVRFKLETAKFIVLKKSIPIENVIDNPKNFIESIDEDTKIDDYEIKVFIDQLDQFRKDGYTRVKAYNEKEVIPYM